MAHNMKIKAKKSALNKFRSMMNDMGGEEYENGMSAKVMAGSPEGLKEGLEKASELMDHEEMEYNDMDYDSYSKEELIEMLKKK